MIPTRQPVWLIPVSGGMVDGLPALLDTVRSIGAHGALVVSEIDYALNVNDYDSLDLPQGWTVLVVKSGDAGHAVVQAHTDMYDGLDWRRLPISEAA